MKRWIACGVFLIIGFPVAAMRAAEPIPMKGEVPMVTVPAYGFYPTRWRPFPGTPPENKPIAISGPVNPMVPRVEAPGNISSRPIVQPERGIITPEERRPISPPDDLRRVSPYAPVETAPRELRPKPTGISGDPFLVPIPDPFTKSSSSSGEKGSKEPNSVTPQNSKAWLDLPISRSNQEPIIRASGRELPTRSNTTEKPQADPWRSAPR